MQLKQEQEELQKVLSQKVLTKINTIFGTGYGEKDIKEDNGRKFIEVTYKEIKFKQYISDKDGKIIDFTEKQVKNLTTYIKDLTTIGV